MKPKEFRKCPQATGVVTHQEVHRLPETLRQTQDCLRLSVRVSVTSRTMQHTTPCPDFGTSPPVVPYTPKHTLQKFERNDVPGQLLTSGRDFVAHHIYPLVPSGCSTYSLVDSRILVAAPHEVPL